MVPITTFHPDLLSKLVDKDRLIQIDSGSTVDLQWVQGNKTGEESLFHTYREVFVIRLRRIKIYKTISNLHE